MAAGKLRPIARPDLAVNRKNAFIVAAGALAAVGYHVLRFAFRRIPASLRYRIRVAVVGAVAAWRGVPSAALWGSQRGDVPALPDDTSPSATVMGKLTAPSGLVSVVLPVYNHARLLGDSIESVLAQTYGNFELIVVDDGSTDGVDAVLAKYADHPKVRILRQRNQKLPAALSNGFQFARGEFWTWTSADNLMQPDQLLRQVEFLRANPQVAMVYADYLAIDDRGRPLSDRFFRRGNRKDPADPEIHLPRTTARLLKDGDNFIGPCFMYRGWVGTLLGDYDAALGVEDYDYWLRVDSSFRIAHLGTEETLYQYRVHDDSLSGRAVELRIAERYRKLLTYHTRRKAYCRQPWTIHVDDATWEKIEGIETGAHRLARWRDPSSRPALAAEKNLLLIPAASLKAVADLGLPEDVPVVAWFSDEPAEAYRFWADAQRAKATCFTCHGSAADRLRVLRAPTIEFRDWADLVPLAVRHANDRSYRFVARAEAPRMRILPDVYQPGHARLQVLLQAERVEESVFDLAQSLDPARFSVTILILGDEGAAAAIARQRGIRVRSLPDSDRAPAYRQLLIDERIDLVNAYDSWFGDSIAGDLAIPFVQTVEGADGWAADDEFTSAYLCPSPEAARYCDLDLGLPAEKIVVMPKGADFGNVFLWIVSGGAPVQARCWADSPSQAVTARAA